MLYTFDGIGEDLHLIPLSARRALDCAGYRLSREGWWSLGLPDRRALVEFGAAGQVNVDAVGEVVTRAAPGPQEAEKVSDPPTDAVPTGVQKALGQGRPLDVNVWLSLSPLDRYVLAKVVAKGREERIDGAYKEIVGHSATSSHVAPGGGVRMVDVGQKDVTHRTAVARSCLTMNEEALGRLVRDDVPKGDVLGTARVAGVMAAKRTADLIPLCHPLALTRVDIQLDVVASTRSVHVVATVETVNRTGVEMEALVAASVTALTVYDMLKAFDRAMVIGPTELTEKSGGRTGDYRK